MPKRRLPDPAIAEALLARARRALPEARARFDALVERIADQLPDPRHMRDVGRMLEEIARGKLYLVGGHATFATFLRDALGISRTTAHRLRTVARAPTAAPKRGKVVAYEAAQRAVAKARASGPSRAARRR